MKKTTAIKQSRCVSLQCPSQGQSTVPEGGRPRWCFHVHTGSMAAGPPQLYWACSKDHVFWKVVMKLDSQAWFKSHIFILINSKKTGYHKTQQITPAAGGWGGGRSEGHCYIGLCELLPITALTAGPRHSITQVTMGSRVSSNVLWSRNKVRNLWPVLHSARHLNPGTHAKIKCWWIAPGHGLNGLPASTLHFIP